MISTDALLDATRGRFPDLADEKLQLVPIEKGGSDRWFYRIRIGTDRMRIVMHYGRERAENHLYVHAAQFLAGLGIRVPQILAHDDFERLVWMQDLGDRDLWSHREDPWPDRRSLYVEALRQVFVLHSRGHLELNGDRLALNPPFDEELYRWEQHYFFQHCVDGHFGLPVGEWEALRDGALLRLIRERLASLPRTLVHRDFQSQNLIVAGGHVHLIDFQGIRFGLPHYDLASLLYDPYTRLAPDEQVWLLATYQEGWRAAGLPDNDFLEVFHLCALQRLMQALGAYGFLGHVKDRPWFLAHIPPALASLRTVAARIEGLGSICDLLDKLRPHSL